ncbi:MAG TPA: winged helix-turn-helix domain-containing protein [Rhizomicrobium sp.]|nr:winged helix-turn-helix domain-containing protein [Rhizomicrobium sp.]
MTPLRDPFQVAGFTVEPARNRIAGPGGEIAIEPKLMDLLCVLAGAPGRVFSRGELIDLVWGSQFGADESLTRAISQLRKLLGDSREEPRILETISKRGYRLIAPVKASVKTPVMTAPAASGRARYGAVAALVLVLLGGFAVFHVIGHHGPAAAPPAPAPGDGATVTIAPFFTDDPTRRLLARRLREGLITDISRDSLIHVSARPAASGDFRYQVEGTIESPDGRLSVNVRLLDQSTGNNLWAENFAGRKDELVGAIAAGLEPRLLAAVKTELARKPILTLKPWQLNLLATWIPGTDQVFLSPHTPDAFWPQRRALALQPGYAPAHATLASGLAYHALFSPAEDTPARLDEARRHAEAAVAGAPFDPQVLYEIATYYRLTGEREQAALMLRRVLEISPDNIEARIDLPFVEGQCNAKSGEAVAALERIGQQLSPDNPIRRVVLSHLADLHLSRGEYDKAADAAMRSRAIVPSVWSGITLAAADAQAGRVEDALASAAETRLEWPDLDFARFARQLGGVWCLGGPDVQPARRAFETLAAAQKLAKTR